MKNKIKHKIWLVCEIIFTVPMVIFTLPAFVLCEITEMCQEKCREYEPTRKDMIVINDYKPREKK